MTTATAVPSAPAAPQMPRGLQDSLEPVVFVSKSEELALVRMAATSAIDRLGAKHKVPGLRYEFVAGRLEILPGQDRMHVWDDPVTQEPIFQDALEWLREHRLFGLTDGFWELPPQAPPSEPVLDAILAAAIQGNLDGILGAYESERTTWKRGDVLQQCKRAALQLGYDVTQLPEPELEDANQQPAGLDAQAARAAALASTDDEVADAAAVLSTSGRPHTLEEKGIQIEGTSESFGA